MIDANKFKLGLFVCIALAAIAIGAGMLGMADRFKDKAHITTFVSESIQGLTNGSSVKYRGVPIGAVNDITISPTDKLIRIDMTINLSKFKTDNTTELDTASINRTEFYSYLIKDINNGLRCKLEPDGITGMKYIELDFVQNPSDKFIRQPGFKESQVFYIPSVPSIISDLRTSVTGILAKLEAIDYNGIANEVSGTLKAVHTFISNPDFPKTVQNIEEVTAGLKKTVDTLNSTLNAERIDAFVNHTETVMKSIDDMADFVKEEITDAKLGKTTQDTREALNTISDAGTQLSETLMKLNEGLDALTELIQLLDSDPSSILRGKSKAK